MREIELKGVVPDERAARALIEADGATLVFEGDFLDRRYDTPRRDLAMSDRVLRLRYQRASGSESAVLAFKGAASVEGGYKVREELGTGVERANTMHDILSALGYIITREIDREVAVYVHYGAVVRFERYPRMDVLVEVEGEPDAIERAIEALRIPREHFTADALAAFVHAYEERTGARAAICQSELTGEFRYPLDDA